MRREEDPEIRVLNEISSMIVHVLQTPSPVTFPFSATQFPEIQVDTTSWQISPATFASLFFGISLALMLFGLIIFLIGVILMPWIIGLVLMFNFVGVLSTLLGFGREFLCWAVSPRDVSAWKCI